MARSSPGRLSNRVDDPRMRSAAADVAVHAADDLILGRVRLAREQRHRRHDHPSSAVTALHRVKLREGLLNRMQAPGRDQAFNLGDALSLNGAYRRYARAHRLAVDQDRARATLTLPAAVLGTG